MKRRTVRQYLLDILYAAEHAQQFIAGMSYDEFLQDDKTIFAVIRALEVIGEAVKKIPASTRKAYPEVPWRAIAGMRDKLIHDYFTIDAKRVYDTVVQDIPMLVATVRRILEYVDGGTNTEAS
jgi:uncharacterized protein with HEPN domain